MNDVKLLEQPKPLERAKQNANFISLFFIKSEWNIQLKWHEQIRLLTWVVQAIFSNSKENLTDFNIKAKKDINFT